MAGPAVITAPVDASGNAADPARVVPASSGQRLLWLFEHYRGRPGMLNCPLVCRITGPVDRALLSHSLTRLTERHESLRTTFEGRGRRLLQLVHRPRNVELAIDDLTGEDDPETTLDRALRAELRTSIDATAWPVRTRLWRLADEDHVLVVKMHHLVSDQASCALLFEDLVTAYGEACGEAVPPADRSWQYRQFAAWQQRMLDVGGFQADMEYWRERLRGARPVPLPLRAHDAGSAGARSSADASVSSDAAARLAALASANHTTTFAVMLAVFYACIHRLTGAIDVSVASLFANRARPEVRRTVGLVVQLVVLRCELPPGATFLELTRRAHDTVGGALSHQGLPYHLVAQPAATSDVRMDEVVFHMLPEGIGEFADAGPVRFEALVPDVTGRFDVELAVMPTSDGMAVKLYFTEDRLDADVAHRLVSEYVRLAHQFATDADALVGDVRPA